MRRAVLDRSVDQAVRRLAHGYLEAAAEARVRVDRASDPNALHDLHVALRRLRSWHVPCVVGTIQKNQTNARAIACDGVVGAGEDV